MAQPTRHDVDGIPCLRSGRRAARSVRVRSIAGDCPGVQDPRYKPMVLLVLDFDRVDKEVCAMMSREAVSDLIDRLQSAIEPT